MKKLLLTLTASLACLGAFAQGKILFTTDSLHLVYYSADPRNASLGGQAISSVNGSSLVADLYMGTSSSSLFLISSTTFGGVPGKWNNMSVTVNTPAYPTGTAVFIIAQIRDSAHPASATLPSGFGEAEAQAAGYAFWGRSAEFSFTLGGPITYPPMYNSPNWPVGTFDLSATAGAGAMGAIPVVSLVPEPGSFALAGLGAAAMLIFRRRK
jgi:hypothetical protein